MLEKLTFDIVIATRNRPEALALSIPLILGQSRQPEKLIIIDSSDDHQVVKSVVEKAVKSWPGKVILRSSEKGIPLQRNIGLGHVSADVVFFPDDDSMLYPGTTEALMRVYELDSQNWISGVCTAAAQVPPPSFPKQDTYQMTEEMQKQVLTTPIKNRFRKIFNSLDPVFYVGGSLMNRYSPPPWFRDENCVLVEFMSGYRMSFRSCIIKKIKFNTNLGDYAHCEDYDASFSASSYGALVGARNGKVYHHKFPSGRGSAFKLGVMRVLNTSYVVLRHSAANSQPPNRKNTIKLVRKFRWLYQLLYLTRAHTPSGVSFLKGFRAGSRYLHLVVDANEENLDLAYRKAMSLSLLEED